MNMTKHDHQHNEQQDQEHERLRGAYWRRMHHHWYFWVAMILMVLAIVNYVMTEDLSWLPRR
jgi:hypothetical protein